MERRNLTRSGIPGRDVPEDHVLFTTSSPFGDIGSPLNILIEALPHASFIAEKVHEQLKEWRLIVTNTLHHQLTDLGPQHGRLFRDWCSPTLNDYLCSNYDDAVSMWDQISYEEELELPRGKKWWSTTLMPLKTPSGRCRILGCCRDISHIRYAETALSKFLPICSVCKSVKASDDNDDKDTGWIPIETYLRGVKLTHGYCPDCFDRLYGHLKFYNE